MGKIPFMAAKYRQCRFEKKPNPECYLIVFAGSMNAAERVTDDAAVSVQGEVVSSTLRRAAEPRHVPCPKWFYRKGKNVLVEHKRDVVNFAGFDHPLGRALTLWYHRPAVRVLTGGVDANRCKRREAFLWCRA